MARYPKYLKKRYLVNQMIKAKDIETLNRLIKKHPKLEKIFRDREAKLDWREKHGL